MPRQEQDLNKEAAAFKFMKKFISDIHIIWARELIHFWRNKVRVLSGFSFPILWLAVFGTGLSASLSLPVPDIKFIDFLFPGVISQYTIFIAMFGAISILQDREFGFLKEILVSPASRTAIALGKILGGATSAFLQALPIVILGPIMGITYNPIMILALIPAMMLLATTLSALGVAIVSQMRSLDAGQYIFQFITFPVVMLSGAFFPLRNLPLWLDILTKINPLSYTVDLIRRIVFSFADMPPEAVTSLSPVIFGNVPSIGFEIIVTISFAVVLVFIASLSFRKS